MYIGPILRSLHLNCSLGRAILKARHALSPHRYTIPSARQIRPSIDEVLSSSPEVPQRYPAPLSLLDASGFASSERHFERVVNGLCLQQRRRRIYCTQNYLPDPFGLAIDHEYCTVHILSLCHCITSRQNFPRSLCHQNCRETGAPSIWRRLPLI